MHRDETLWALIHAVCENAATPDQVRQLERLVLDDAAACQIYLEYVAIHGSLFWSGRGRSSCEDAPGDSIAAPVNSPSAGLPEGLSNSTAGRSRLFGFLADAVRMVPGGEFTVGTLVILAVVAAFATLQSYRRWVDSADSPQADGATERSQANSEKPSGLTVDELLASRDAPLAVVSAPGDVVVIDHPLQKGMENAARPIAANSHVHVRKSVAELRFRSGVTLTVAGPAELETTSEFNVRLNSGELLARVPADSRGFTVQTPLAAIVDLGTEFGVRSQDDGPTEVTVFKGLVEVVPGDRAKKTLAFERTVQLRAGDSLRVDTAGNVSRVQPASDGPASTQPRILSFAGAPRCIDLADVVAGGNGQGSANGFIDPRTGDMFRALRPEDAGDFINTLRYVSDGQYHSAQGSPWIDGIFIPDSSRGAVQLDSAGHTFKAFGQLDGHSFAPTWGGSTMPYGYFPSRLDVDYATGGHRLIAMHANTGITFKIADLAAQFERSEPTRFTARIGNGTWPAGSDSTAFAWGVWVFVDGQLRFSKPTAYTGSFAVDVPLHTDDQLLTIVTTDGTDTNDGDRVLLGDPRITLQTTSASGKPVDPAGPSPKKM